MPTEHHGNPGMHMTNGMWEYFSLNHWSFWIVLPLFIVAIIWLFKIISNNTNKKEK